MINCNESQYRTCIFAFKLYGINLMHDNGKVKFDILLLDFESLYSPTKMQVSLSLVKVPFDFNSL